jgi:uncharacterized protein YuzE
MLKKLNFDYDPENDSLFIYDTNSKSKASVELDDFIIDFNSNKEICAIEILNASRFFQELDFKESLEGIKECKLDIITKNNSFLIKFIFTFKSNNEFRTPLIIPSINEPSPAIA